MKKREGFMSINIVIAMFIISALILITSSIIVNERNLISEERRNITLRKQYTMISCVSTINFYYAIENALEEFNNSEEFCKSMRYIYGKYFYRAEDMRYFKYGDVENQASRKDYFYAPNYKGKRFIYYNMELRGEVDGNVRYERHLYRLEDPFKKYSEEKIKKGVSKDEIKGLYKEVL